MLPCQINGVASQLVVPFVSLRTPSDCESIVMLSTCTAGMALLELN
jgi:hypothetical protein